MPDVAPKQQQKPLRSLDQLPACTACLSCVHSLHPGSSPVALGISEEPRAGAAEAVGSDSLPLDTPVPCLCPCPRGESHPLQPCPSSHASRHVEMKPCRAFENSLASFGHIPGGLASQLQGALSIR